MNRPNITLHIDRLVLRGFGAHVNRERLGAVVQQELTRLLAEGGGSPSIHRQSHIARVDGGTLHLASGAGTGIIGARIARAVYAGMDQRTHQQRVATVTISAERTNEGPSPSQGQGSGSFSG